MSNRQSGTYVESAGPSLAVQRGQQRGATSDLLNGAHAPIRTELIAGARAAVERFAVDDAERDEFLAILGLDGAAS